MRALFARFMAPSAASHTGPGAPCSNCTAPLAVGQDWCLECGTAVPGRFGRGPGLRSSLGVVGVTLLLVVGAVAAAYAALSSDSRQATQTTASVPAQAAATPDVPGAVAPSTAAAPTLTPVPGAAVVTPGAPATLPAAPKLPAATPTPAAAPVTAAPKTAPAAPGAPTTPKTTTKPKPAKTPHSTGTGGPSAKSAKILLDTDAATTYNPYGLPSSSFGDPAQAIDGDRSTSWTYQLAPGTTGKTQVGLAINLKSLQSVRAITLLTSTPGMTVEFYGATGAQPVSITDPAWLHVGTRRQVGASSTVALKAHGKAFDYLLVWITHAPDGVTSGKLAVSEVSVSS